MSEPDPFAVLEMAPSLDPKVVKHAYFAALARHPPHADADGFRLVRSAYEALVRPGALARAYAACPVDFEAELNKWNGRFAAAITEAEARQRAVEASTEVVAMFIQTASRLPLAALPAAR